MKLPVSIKRDEDGIFIASCLSISGCVSQGNTEKEAEFNIASAIQQCLAARELPAWDLGDVGLLHRRDIYDDVS